MKYIVIFLAIVTVLFSAGIILIRREFEKLDKAETEPEEEDIVSMMFPETLNLEVLFNDVP